MSLLDITPEGQGTQWAARLRQRARPRTRFLACLALTACVATGLVYFSYVKVQDASDRIH